MGRWRWTAALSVALTLVELLFSVFVMVLFWGHDHDSWVIYVVTMVNAAALPYQYCYNRQLWRHRAPTSGRRSAMWHYGMQTAPIVQGIMFGCTFGTVLLTLLFHSVDIHIWRDMFAILQAYDNGALLRQMLVLFTTLLILLVMQCGLYRHHHVNASPEALAAAGSSSSDEERIAASSSPPPWIALSPTAPLITLDEANGGSGMALRSS